MDYKKAFIKLYGAVGAALDEFCASDLEFCNAVKILKEAISQVEEMDAELEAPWESQRPEGTGSR